MEKTDISAVSGVKAGPKKEISVTSNGNKSGTINTDLLEAIFRTSKKTIQEYVEVIRRYNSYRSIAPGITDGMYLDDRARLMDLYEACDQQDSHLMSVRETLNSQITGEKYSLGRYVGDKFVIDKDQTEKIRGTEFTKLIVGIVDSKMYGYTVIEIMDDIDPYTGKLAHINIIERRNVLPSQHRVVQRQGIWSPGWDLFSQTYSGRYILIDTGNLGLYSSIVPDVLAKKFTTANYINFSHTYGQPIIHGKSVSEDMSDRKTLANNIASAAQNKVIVTGLEDEIDVKAFTMANSEQVFTGLIDRVDKNTSNLIVGSESMAGATQSYVGSTKAHEDIFRDRVQSYRNYIENIMNEQVLPRLKMMGYIDGDMMFQYDKRTEMSTDQRTKAYAVLLDHYKIAPEEIEKDFHVIVGEQINTGENAGLSGTGGGSGDDRYIMSDEEYYKRYGHARDTVNFLRGRAEKLAEPFPG